MRRQGKRVSSSRRSSPTTTIALNNSCGSNLVCYKLVCTLVVFSPCLSGAHRDLSDPRRRTSDSIPIGRNCCWQGSGPAPRPPKSKINEPKELRFVATLASFVGSPQKWHVGEGLLVWSGRWGGKIILRHSGENWGEE